MLCELCLPVVRHVTSGEPHLMRLLPSLALPLVFALNFACGGGTTKPSSPVPATPPHDTPTQTLPPRIPEAPALHTPALAAPGSTFSAQVEGPDATLTYTWSISGGTLGPNATTATGASVTVTAGSGSNLILECAASNAASHSSPTSAVVTLANVPMRPAGVTATAGNEQVSLSWQEPGANGSPVTAYAVDISPEVANADIVLDDTHATVSGLTNGVAYVFTVSATNEVGASPASDPTTTATPGAVPSNPDNVVALRGDQRLPSRGPLQTPTARPSPRTPSIVSTPMATASP